MAVKRVNLPGAIDQRITGLARARTAIVRRGVVTVVPDVNGVAKVALGGGTVDAVCMKSSDLAVNDQVVVLADTDAYWVIGEVGVGSSPPVPVVTDFDSTAFAAATGFSVDVATKGKLVTFGGVKWATVHLQAARTGAPLTASSVGNIGDTTVLTIPNQIWPAERLFGHFTANGTAGSCNVTVSGLYNLIDMYPSQTLATGAVFNADFTYLYVQ